MIVKSMKKSLQQGVIVMLRLALGQNVRNHIRNVLSEITNNGRNQDPQKSFWSPFKKRHTQKNIRLKQSKSATLL